MKIANSKKLAATMASFIFFSVYNFSPSTGNFACAMDKCKTNFNEYDIDEKIRLLFEKLDRCKILKLTDEFSPFKSNFFVNNRGFKINIIGKLKMNAVYRMNKNFWILTKNQKINRAILKNDGTLEYYRGKELVFSTTDADKIRLEPICYTSEVDKFRCRSKGGISFYTKCPESKKITVDCASDESIKATVNESIEATVDKFICENDYEFVLEDQKISFENFGTIDTQIVLKSEDSIEKSFYVSDILKICYKCYDNLVLKYDSDNNKIFDKYFCEDNYDLTYKLHYDYIRIPNSNSNSNSESYEKLTDLDAFNLGIKFRLDYYRRLLKGLIEILYNNNSVDFDYIEAIDCNSINDSKSNFDGAETKKNNNTNALSLRIFKNNKIIDEKNYDERHKKLLKVFKDFNSARGLIHPNK